MTYLLLIILVGIAIYYAIQWGGTTKKTGSDQDNPYNTDNQSNRNMDSGPYKSQGTSRSSSGSNYAKWIGGGLGWAFGGPIGGILGFMFGSMMDGSGSPLSGVTGGQPGRTRSGDFNISLLILAAAVMKADGRVTRNELDYVKQFLAKNYGADRSSQLIKILGDLLKQDYNIQDVSSQIRQFMDYSSRLMLLQFMFGIALSDGKSHPGEVNVIESIANDLGISAVDYGSIKAMFIKETDSAYKILEVTPDASNDDIKKAYRELAKKYHPDKVSHLGEDVKKAAEEKIVKLNAAYEEIKEERGIV